LGFGKWLRFGSALDARFNQLPRHASIKIIRRSKNLAMILEKNVVWVGAIVGLLVPFVGYAILLMLSEWLDVALATYKQNKVSIIDTNTLLLLAICTNLLPFHLFDRNRQRQSMRGVMLATLILGVIWVIYYGFTL
jgi:heme/copper-type cytochrome/quinol oxidase subunit 3